MTDDCSVWGVELTSARAWLGVTVSAALLFASSCVDDSGEPKGKGDPIGAGGASVGTAPASTEARVGPSNTGGVAGVSSASRGDGVPSSFEGVSLAGASSMGAAASVAPGVNGNAGSSDAALGGPAIVDLFNGTDLAGWTAYRETSQNSPGTLLSADQAKLIFQPVDGTIRVYGDAENGSTQARHTLLTTQSYTKYKLWVEYRWGTKVFAPYTDLTRYPRDAGILFHVHGDLRVVWPSSIEFQIKEGTTGDIFALFARCTSLAQNAGTTFVAAAEGGTEKLVDGANGFVQHGRSANFELPDWNSLELQVDGGTALYLVNGHVVNAVRSIADKSGSVGMPITSGPIALQSEHAEVFYRNIRIQVLP